MNHIYNIALNINNENIYISLSQNGNSPSKIMLGGVEYGINYTGIEDHRLAIIHELEEKFKVDAVTKESLQVCLQSFGHVVVTELSEKLQRGLNRAKLIGKGMQAIHERSLNNSADEAHGRMIQEPYYIEVQKNQSGEVFTNQKRQLFMLWKEDKSTNLSLPEWEAYKQKQWENSNDSAAFLPWLYTSEWKKSGTKDDMFTWYLRIFYKELKISVSFDEWKPNFVKFINQHFAEFLKKDATQDEILQSWTEQMISGSHLMGAEYIEFISWQQANSPEPFADWMLHKEWDKSQKTVSFDEYKLGKLHELEERWNKSGLQSASMDFDTWRKVQDPTLFDDSGLRAFIHCDDETRKFYKLELTSSGNVSRNNTPYTTAYETTLHSGQGYAIFVIGPNQAIYAASHIPGVFHHSSFFADGAILAGGELRMGLDLVYGNAKDDKQKKSMLKSFAANNKDSYKIQFIKNDKINAWTISGEDSTGKIQVKEIPRASQFHQDLQSIDFKTLSYTQRADILDKAANLLGRTNPSDQITLLSSKSGHYHPTDEENYYMLKLWERKGIDLSKITFTSLGLMGSSLVYRSAKEYVDQIEPLILARQQTRLFIESGRIQDNQHQPLTATEKTIVITKNGECYLSDNYHDTFKHPEILMAKNLPGFQNGDMILKQSVQLEINRLQIKKASINEHISELDRLIKQTTKSARAKRSGRLIVKESELSRVDKIIKQITALEKSMEPSLQPGKQEIRGAGKLTIKSNGEIEKIDAKLGNYILSEKEIEKTLLTFKRAGVKLENVTLIAYEKSGHPEAPHNANQWLVNKYAATKASLMINPNNTAPQTTTAAATIKYRGAITEIKDHNQSDSSQLTPVVDDSPAEEHLDNPQNLI